MKTTKRIAEAIKGNVLIETSEGTLVVVKGDVIALRMLRNSGANYEAYFFRENIIAKNDFQKKIFEAYIEEIKKVILN